MHRIVTVSQAYSVTILQKGIHQQQFRLESPFESPIKASGKDISYPPPKTNKPGKKQKSICLFLKILAYNLGLSQFFSTFVTRLIIFLILQINKISNH